MSIERARRARADKGRALAKLADGSVGLPEVLKRPPEALWDVDLYDVLMRVPWMGKERTRTVCERAKVWPHLTLREMSAAQRAAVIGNLPGRVL